MDGEPLQLATVPAIGNRLHVSFGLGNELHIVDLSSNNKSKDSTASVLPWGELSAPHRRIAYDSLGVYQLLHQRALEPLSPERWSATLHYSKTLSSILAADGVRGAEATPEELQVLQERAFWDLLSLFFLDSITSSTEDGAHSVAQSLVRWLRENATAVAGSVAEAPLPPPFRAALAAASLPEAVPTYWPTAARLVALGWIDEAIELLGQHSAWLRYDGSDAVQAADSAAKALVAALEAATLLLKRFPTLGDSTHSLSSAGRVCTTLSEFTVYRRTWQAQCVALAADNGVWSACQGADIATSRGLRAMLSVLAGDEEALQAATHNWLELLVAELLHVYPTARAQAELKQLARRCFEAGSGTTTHEFLQAASGLLEACADLDAQAAMRVCSNYCSSWFMAHAPALMEAHPAGAAILERELPHAGGSQVEFYTLELALSLAPHPHTWPLAAAYLAWCPAHGQPALEALLEQLHLDAGELATCRKAVEVAQYHGLYRSAENIQRAQGALCWQAGMLGAALSWFAACSDVRRVDIALQPLASAVSQGRLSDDQRAALDALQPLLETLPPGSSNAALLAVHRLLQRGGRIAGGTGMHAAVEALARLPDSMRDSCLQLVCSAVSVLPPGELSESDVAFLLQWLLGAEGRLPTKQRVQLGAAIQAARLALVRSLAGSHMVHQQNNA